MAEDEELAVPLLQRRADEEAGAQAVSSASGLDFGKSVLNLVKCVLGAGLLSIPLAYSLLGAVLGTALFLGVGLITAFTIRWGQVLPSISPDGACLRYGTYSSLVSHWVGSSAERLLTFMMLLGLLGFEVSYMDIIADILVGDVKQHNPGILSSLVLWLCQCAPYGPDSATALECMPHAWPLLLGSGAPCSHALGHAYLAVRQQPGAVDSTDIPTWVWLALDRRVVLAVVVSLLITPLSLQRHMANLNLANLVGTVSLAAFSLCLVWLSVAAVVAGQAHSLPLLPDLERLGDTVMTQVLRTFGVLSVLLTANGCHANMHPLMSVMQPFTKAQVDRVVLTTISITTTYYLLVSTCSYVVFGPTILEDILANLSVQALQPLVGSWTAQAMAVLLRVGYLLSIVGSAVLTMFPLRQAVADLLLGPPPPPPVAWVAGGMHAAPAAQAEAAARHGEELKTHQDRRGALHAPLTLGLLGLAFALAVAIPSIWIVVSLIGSVSVTTISFLMPALTGICALRSQGRSRSPLAQAMLGFAAFLGILIFINGFFSL